MFNGLLFFPVTPYRGDGYVDLDELAAHVGRGVDAGAGGVFAACGTGEFSALEPDEYAEVVRAAVAAAGGRVPVFAGDLPKADDPLGKAYIQASAGKRKALTANGTFPLKGQLKAMLLASGGEVRDIGKRKPANPLAKSAPPDMAEDKSDNARSV